MNVAILMKNQNLQQPFIESNAWQLTSILLKQNMISGLVDTLKNMNNTTCNNNLAINSLNYTRNFLLSLAEIDHRLNQFQNGLKNLESNVLTIYNYIHSLGNKVVTPTLFNLIDLRTM